jgi:uncharacterized membrane protein YdbT with pleckstrin-like domain
MARRNTRGNRFDNPEEKELFHAKESWIPVVLGALPIVLVGIAAFVVAWRFFDKLQIGLIILGVSVVVAFVTRIPRIIANLDTDVVVTDKRLYARTGIIDIKDQVCDLSNVSDVTVDPSVLGRIFDYANVRIQTKAGDDDFVLKEIKDAYKMRQVINTGRDELEQASQPPAQGGPRR